MFQPVSKPEHLPSDGLKPEVGGVTGKILWTAACLPSTPANIAERGTATAFGPHEVNDCDELWVGSASVWSITYVI